MVVAAPDLSAKTIPQLLEALSAGQPGSPMHQQAAIMLQFRIAEKQAEAGERQATATDQLVTATQDLAAFTRTLVMATKALVFFGGATLVLTLVQVLKAVGVLR
jgi:uncharacterized protein GlcG (DUF336 family)